MTQHLVTAKKPDDHVSSADAGAMQAAIIGDGRYVTNEGNGFAVSYNSANEIVVATGSAFFDGRFFRVTAPETVTISSGTQSMKRNDILGIRYTKDSVTAVENGELYVVEGTPSSGTPADPDLPDGNILLGSNEAFMPLWRLPIDGVSLGDAEQLFAVLSSTISCPWPVGSILQLTSGGDPNVDYPGTVWERWEAGRFPVAAGTGYTVGSKGGVKDVTLTQNQMPNHSHAVTGGGITNGIGGGSHSHQMSLSNEGGGRSDWGLVAGGAHGGHVALRYTQSATRTNTSATTHVHSLPNHTHACSGAGGSQAHTNIPPYKAVWIWERTS